MASDVHHVLIQAIRAHWTANAGAYPQRIILTPAQQDALNAMRTIGRAGVPPADLHEFLGCKIERQDGARPALIAADGAEVPLDL